MMGLGLMGPGMMGPVVMGQGTMGPGTMGGCNGAAHVLPQMPAWMNSSTPPENVSLFMPGAVNVDGGSVNIGGTQNVSSGKGGKSGDESSDESVTELTEEVRTGNVTLGKTVRNRTTDILQGQEGIKTAAKKAVFEATDPKSRLDCLVFGQFTRFVIAAYR